jgi:hypothetical protein
MSVTFIQTTQANNLEDRLIGMDYYFPRLEMYLTAIPKTGCTSSMNFFAALELFLLNNDLALSDNLDQIRIESKSDELASTIHSSESSISRYLTTLENSSIPSSTLFIGIYRNPIDRFESFWTEKIVLQGDPNYLALSNLLLTEENVVSLYETADAAKSFLNKLDFSNPESIDPHVRPQSSFMLPIEKYDLLIETKNLGYILECLAEKSPKYNFLRKLKFPHHNNLPPTLKGTLRDFELMNVINNVYKSDFQMFQFPREKINLGTFRFYSLEQTDFILKHRAQNKIKNLTQQRDELTQQRDELTQQRDELTQQRDELTQQRDELLNSTIWKLTKPVRWFVNLIKG